MDVTLYDYQTPVHKVFFQSNQVLGVGLVPAMFILVLTIVLVNLISKWCFIFGIVLFIIAKLICKKDEYMLVILFNRLLENSIWRAS